MEAFHLTFSLIDHRVGGFEAGTMLMREDPRQHGQSSGEGSGSAKALFLTSVVRRTSRTPVLARNKTRNPVNTTNTANNRLNPRRFTSMHLSDSANRSRFFRHTTDTRLLNLLERRGFHRKANHVSTSARRCQAVKSRMMRDILSLEGP